MISVIIPTYNRSTWLAEAIQSIQLQAISDIEIIVADDGSTDNTADIVAQFGQAVIYLRLPHRGQPAATRNAGLRIAQGEFIAFLDSDDLFLPDKLNKQLPILQANPNLGLVYSDGIFFRDDPAHPTGHVLTGLPTLSGDQAFAELLRGNFLAPPVVLIRRACIDAVGLFDERVDFFAVEDYDLWLRLAARFSFAYVPGEVAAIRRHRQSISRDIVTLRERELRVLKKMDELFPNVVYRHSRAWHEGYALSHGFLAVERLRQHRFAASAREGLNAVNHLSHLPRFGLGTLTTWWKRRALRQGVRQ